MSEVIHMQKSLAECENNVRDIINYIRVKQKEEVPVEGGATRIDTVTAEELVCMLEQLAEAMSGGSALKSRQKGHRH